MFDFDCITRRTGSPAGPHKGNQQRAGDITVARTAFLTFWSSKKTIWQSHEKVFIEGNAKSFLLQLILYFNIVVEYLTSLLNKAVVFPMK